MEVPRAGPVGLHFVLFRLTFCFKENRCYVLVFFFIRLRRRPRAVPVDECVTCASTLDVLKLVASADFATGG